MEEQTEQTVALPPYEEPNDEDDEEDGPRFTETNLNFRDFLLRLPHPKVVRACGLALRNFETNSPATNHSILKLLHRIAFDCKMYVMVFQLSIFKTFQRILSMRDNPQYKELAKFATYVLRQFFKVAQTNKTIFVETLFWKSKRDAFEIENGYGSSSENSKAASNFWSEEQEDELRRLFMEHQSNKVEEDIVDWIVDNLVDHTRTRRAVLKKLKEMCLLVDQRHGGGRSGARVPVTWAAEEEEQLRELYDEFKDAMDPLGCIMARLEVPRPKNRIVEKLLVLGLIQDKKEVYKKRARGSGPSKSRPADSNSDSDSDDATPRPTLKKPDKPSLSVNQRARNVSSQRKKNHVVVGKVKLVELLLENSGRNEALNWLKESISDAIEDVQDGFDEGIPLVPIMDYAQEALENEEFKKLLHALGICEPFDEQETYWRIPTHLSVNILQEHCTLIQQALDGTLTVPNAEPTVDTDSSDPDGLSSVGDEGRGSPKPSGSQKDQPTKDQTRMVRRPSSDSSNEGTNEHEDGDAEIDTTGQSRVRRFFDYSSDEENGNSDKENGRGAKTKNTNDRGSGEENGRRARKRNTIDSDSDEENENSDEENGRRAKKRNTIDSGSEEDNERGAGKKNTINSDSEDEENSKKRRSGSDSEKAPVKKRRIVDSDDGDTA